MSHDETIYARILQRATALKPGDHFTIRCGPCSDYGIFDGAVDAATAVIRIRVKVHQYAEAKAKKIRARLALDGSSIEVYRRAV